MASCRLADAEIAAVLRILKSGRIRQGAEVIAFERAFAKRFGAGYAVACASGTAALQLAYSASFKPGDEVLVPALTFVATAAAVAGAGGIPVACDVDSETWLIDLDDAASRVTPRTRAIVPVHLFGNVCDPVRIAAFAETHGLNVIWDAAQAHGATWDGIDIGTFGPITCFSLYATKNLFVGEGGMVCVQEPGTAAAMQRSRNHGLDEAGAWVEQGSNHRMPEMAGAIGLAQLQRFDGMLARRRRNAQHLTATIEGIPGLSTQNVGRRAGHAWSVFAVCIDPNLFRPSREALIRHFAAAGIGTRIYYPLSVNQHPYFRQHFGCHSCPIAESLTGRLVALPVHHDLVAADVERIHQALISISTDKGLS